ncbi:MAG: dTDP-4-dehydrorhamnose reductase [Simkania sp.]|nr:dTDP-4-dehydrorhamnose reductase [Simkania sp.]
MMKIWILGGQGFIGRALQLACMRHGISWVASSREEADITDARRLIKIGDCIRPTHIINCAALTKVDLVEKEPERAFAVNTIGAKYVAVAALELGAQLLHLSTETVFDGLQDRPYKEEDPCRALCIYGQSKLGGEQWVREVMQEACILRTSWVFGLGSNHKLSQWIQRFAHEDVIHAPIDEIGSPTYVHDLAETILAMLDKSGTFHFANQGELSLYHYARDLHQALRERNPQMRCREIKAVTSTHFSRRESRPSFGVLDTSYIGKILGKQPRSWKQVLEDFIKEL